MTRQQALNQDKSFYADCEGDDWFVFGDNSGFAYRNCRSYEEAQFVASELNEGSLLK